MVGINWACGHLPPLTEVLHRLPLLRPPVPPGGEGGLSRCLVPGPCLSCIRAEREGFREGWADAIPLLGEMVGCLWRHTWSVFPSGSVIPRVLCEALQPGPPRVTTRWLWHQTGDYRLVGGRSPRQCEQGVLSASSGGKPGRRKKRLFS